MTHPTTTGPGDPSDGSTRGRVLLIGLVLPLLAAAVLVWATTSRPDNLDRVPVAVVNNDQIIQDPQPMAAGRALAAALTQPSPDQTNLDWTLADTDDAAAGLADGDYYAVLTIPPDFSQAILSPGTDDPEQGRLTLVSNAAASTTVPFISQAVASAAANSLGQQSTQSYLGQVYDGFNTLASSNQNAASSAGQVADGTSQVAQGAAQLGAGAGQLSAGLDQLSTGATELAGRTPALRSGADDLAAGARDLAVGARRLDTGAGDLARSTRTLVGRQRELAGRARDVAAGATKVSRAAQGVAVGSRILARRVNALARRCERAGGSQLFCDALDRTGRRSELLVRGTTGVARLTRAVARADDRLAAGAGELVAGTVRVAAGADALSAAAGGVSAGADDVSAGATSLELGATETDQAAGELATGAASSATAGNELASSSQSLSGGAASTDQGAQQLSQGLAELADSSPTYSEKQQRALAPVVSQPVELTSSVAHQDHGNGWLLAVVLAVVLWLAALLGVLGRDVGAVLRHSGTPVSSRRLTLVQLRPATGLALLQGASVLAALPLLQVGGARPVVLGLLTLVAAATFTLLGVALRWALGGAGIVVFVLFLLFQAAALGNVLPIETAPGPLPLLNGLMPLTAYVDGASQLVSGGSVGSLVGVVAVLLAWSAGATLVSLMVVRRRRVARPRVAATA